MKRIKVNRQSSLASANALANKTMRVNRPHLSRGGFQL